MMMVHEVPRHLVALSVSLAGVKDADGRVWNQVAYEGQWKGHSAGEFQFTRSLFNQIVRNFQRRTDPIPLTWGHPDGETGAFMGAAGWIHALKVNTDNEGREALFALMEFSERAASMVKAGEHRHCSVVVGFDGVDEKTGELVGAELYEVGLVLSAFIDGMTRLAASREGAAQTSGQHALTKETKMSDQELMKKAFKELGEDASLEMVAEWVRIEKSKAALLEGKDPAEASDEEAPEEDVAASKEGDEDEIAAGAETPDETVELSADEAALEMPGEGEEPGAEGMLADFASALAAEMGIDLPALVALMDERRDAIMAALGSAPEEGTEADAPAAMSKSHTEALTALSRTEAANVDLSRRNVELAANLELADFKVELSGHVLKGDITDNQMSALVAVATDEDYGDKAVKFARKELAKQVKTPAVPQGTVRNPGAPSESGNSVAKLSRDEILAEARAKVDADPANANKKRSALHREVMNIAKAHPDFANAE